MQPFGKTAATTGAVTPHTGIVILVFGLTDFSIHADVIDANIAVPTVIGKDNADLATGTGIGGVVTHNSAGGPCLNGGSLYLQAHVFIANHTTHAYRDGIASVATR